MEDLLITLQLTSERLGLSELDLVQLLQYQYGLGMSEEHSQLQDILWDLESVCRTHKFGERIEYPIDRIADLVITLENW